MSFENGVKTPLFEMGNSSIGTLKTIQVDTTHEIRYVSIRIEKTYKYTGLRLYDDEEVKLVNESWLESGDWTRMQRIPSG